MRASNFFVNGRPSPLGWLAGGAGLVVLIVAASLALHHRQTPSPAAKPSTASTLPAKSAPAAESTPALPDFEVKPASVEEGEAKWYDVPEGSLAQRRAWPGEMTAASDRLPKDSYARVRRIDDKGNPDKTVVVRITDHGVGSHGTLIDLDREAAEALGMVKAGQVRVRVEILSLKNATTDKPVEKKDDPPLVPKVDEITNQPAADQQQEKDNAEAKTGSKGAP